MFKLCRDTGIRLFFNSYADTILSRRIFMQVNIQSLVLVSVFRQASRERIMEWIEWCLPDRIPILWDRFGYRETPAQILHRFVVNRIKGFQASVALQQSCQRFHKQVTIFSEKIVPQTPTGLCTTLEHNPSIQLYTACLPSDFIANDRQKLQISRHGNTCNMRHVHATDFVIFHKKERSRWEWFNFVTHWMPCIFSS